MEFTPRILQDAQSSLVQWNGSSKQSPYIELKGIVRFSMVDDLARINSGYGKFVDFYPSIYTFTQLFAGEGGTPTNLLLGVNSISVYDAYAVADTSGVASLYDECYELELLSGFYNYIDSAAPLLTCWHWGQGFTSISKYSSSVGGLMFGYDGSPTNVMLRVRPGMVNGVTPADEVLDIGLTVRLFPGRQASSASACIPSPACMPPFFCDAGGAMDGTWLFSQHATHYMPAVQSGPWSRVFQSNAIGNYLLHGGPTDANAVCLGGPWKFHVAGHVLGAAPRATAAFSMGEAIQGAKVGDYDENVLDTATDSMATLDSHHVVNGSHISVATDAVQDPNTIMEILAYYP